MTNGSVLPEQTPIRMREPKGILELCSLNSGTSTPPQAKGRSATDYFNKWEPRTTLKAAALSDFFSSFLRRFLDASVSTPAASSPRVRISTAAGTPNMQEEDEATTFCLAAFEAISSGVSARARATGASPVALSGFNLYGLQLRDNGYGLRLWLWAYGLCHFEHADYY